MGKNEKPAARAALPDQIALNFAPKAKGSPTSAAAARSIERPDIHKGQLNTVLRCVQRRQSGGASRAEIAELTGLRLSAVCGRVRTLCRVGIIGSNPNHRRRPQVVSEHLRSKELQEVLVAEQYVERWHIDGSDRIIPRRQRSMLDGEPCDIICKGDALDD